MLPKWIERKEKNDNYRALALYIADASRGKVQGEKTLLSWYAGGNAEDYLSGLIEVKATQAMNTRSRREKTYHLMISFRPEDEVKLNPEFFREIEREFALALGFEEHQRHCGVHKNTDNIHMHIAYNMITPETFNRRDPYYHIQKIHRKARELERKYGLLVDKGMKSRETESQPGKITVNAKTMEAHSGQQSFQRHVVNNLRENLIDALETSAGWPDLHRALDIYGLEIVPYGAGLVIKNQTGKETIKASSLARGWGKGQLEKRFGSYRNRTGNEPEEPGRHYKSNGSKRRYHPKPSQLGYNRNGLYDEFQAGRDERKKELDALNQERQAALDEVRERFRAKYASLEKAVMLKIHRQETRQLLKLQEQDELAAAKKMFQDRQDKRKTKIPYTSWASFLKWKAGQGDETALAVLRSRREKVEPEKAVITPNYDDLRAIRQQSMATQKEILTAPGMLANHRKALITVTKMRQLAEEEAAAGRPEFLAGFTIDAKGVVIFKLASGGTVRDTGREIHFSAHDPKAKEAAEKFGRLKWGPDVSRSDGNIIIYKAQERKTELNR